MSRSTAAISDKPVRLMQTSVTMCSQRHVRHIKVPIKIAYVGLDVGPGKSARQNTHRSWILGPSPSQQRGGQTGSAGTGVSVSVGVRGEKAWILAKHTQNAAPQPLGPTLAALKIHKNLHP